MSDAHSVYRGSKVLVTGGLGFLGSNLAKRLVELEADVTLVDSMIPRYGASNANVETFRDRLRINYSDMRDPHSLRYLVADQKVIFNLAGQVSHIDSMRDPLNDLDINCRSQLSLLECCRQVNPKIRIVFTSTRQVYGTPQFLPVDESHPLCPADVNGINKLAAEMYFSLYAKVYGLETVSLRLTNTYGPRMDLTNHDKGFVSVFLDRALRGETIDLFGSGEQRRDFNYVSDVVEAILLAGRCDELDGESYNLGFPQTYSLVQFLAQLNRITPIDYRCTPFPHERKSIDIGDYCGDYSKFKRATGWEPEVDLAAGLRKTLDFFLNQFPSDKDFVKEPSNSVERGRF